MSYVSICSTGNRNGTHAKKAGLLSIDDTHEVNIRILPSDLDVFMELNNGRALTLYDLGRLPFGVQTGLWKAIKINKWGLAVAGASVRYRHRIRLFNKVKIRTKTIGRDARFIYIVQTMYRGETATSNILTRNAITDKNGIVPTQKFAEYMGQPELES